MGSTQNHRPLKLGVLRMRHSIAIVMAASLVCNLWLVGTPGYFSHDELEWLSYMRDGADPWGLGLANVAYSPFYRPLGTALISLILHLPGQPLIAHAALALVQAGNGVLLFLLLHPWLRARALAAAVLFSLTPMAAFATGWVAAFFDLSCVGFSLAALILARRAWRDGGLGWMFGAAGCFGAALLCKETALVAAPALAAAAWMDRRVVRRRPLIILAALVGLLLASYLSLRLPVLLRMAGQKSSGGYAFGGFDAIWHNMRAYLVFPFAPWALEIQNVDDNRTVLTLGMAAHALLLALLAGRYGWRAPFLYLAVFLLPLVPVLAISKHETQYSYATSLALAAGLVAAYGGRWLERLLCLGLVGLVIVHCGVVQAQMHRTGACQSAALASLRPIVADLPADAPILIEAPDSTPWYVLVRLLNGNARYLAKAGIRATVSANAPAATLRMLPDCRVVAR